MQLLAREWPNVLTLLGGLIAIKTMIITVVGPRVGLSLKESIRIGFLLSQGGEFAFVVFSLANRQVIHIMQLTFFMQFLFFLCLLMRFHGIRLGVLPLELNKLLIIVVVLSMALTPLLNELGRQAADFVAEKFETGTVST